MKTNIVGLVFATVCVIVVIGSVLAPSIDKFTQTEETFTNDGYFRMSNLTDSSDGAHTFVWDATDATIVTADGVDYDISTWGLALNQSVCIFDSLSQIIRLGVGDPAAGLSWIQVRGTDAAGSATSSFDATFESGTATIYIDSSSVPVTFNYTDAFLISADGEYTLKKSDANAYILEDSRIFASAYQKLSNGTTTEYNLVNFDGTVDNVTVTSVLSGTDTPTFSDVVVSADSVDGYVGLYDFEKIACTATILSTDNSLSLASVIVPYTVVSELAYHLSDAENALLIVMLPLALFALVLSFAYSFYKVRY